MGTLPDVAVRTCYAFAVAEHEHVRIPLEDGTHLAARLWLPADAEASPVPAILEYLPYRKRDGTHVRDQLTHPYFAGHGYACVRVDMRGSGESGGELLDEYLPQEQSDAVEVIEWLARQSWCSGSVGMMGISWGGFNGLQVAALNPPALKAVISLCSTDQRYTDDIHYKGGSMLIENIGWAATMFSYQTRPPDPALVGDSWKEIWMERLRTHPLMLQPWMEHQHYDEYWQHGSISRDYSKIKAATLLVGGWHDAYSNTVPRMMEGLGCFRRAIIGPWAHKYPHFAVPLPRIGFLQEALRWWDQHLKGIDTGVSNDPNYRIFIMDSQRPAATYLERPGQWISAETWPPGKESLTFRLGKNGILSENPDIEHGVLMVKSPQNCGTASGEWCIIWLGPEWPTDQRVDDARSVCFDTAPTANETMVVGAPLVRLCVTSDQPKCAVFARLCDVHPDGSSTRITYGNLNLCFPDGNFEKPTLLVPGQKYEVSFKLDDVAYTVPPGHKLRLAISTTYWPLFWPHGTPAELALHLDNCSLDIPVYHHTGANRPELPPAEAAAPVEVRTVSEPQHSRKFETDVATGVTRLHIKDDFGKSETVSHGLITQETCEEIYEITEQDPLSCRAHIVWTEEMERGDWAVFTETTTTVTFTEEEFKVCAHMVAKYGNEIVAEREWCKRVPRRWV